MEVSTLSGVVIDSGIFVVIFILGGPAQAAFAINPTSNKMIKCFVLMFNSPFVEGSEFTVHCSGLKHQEGFCHSPNC
jgi:hypothetical protein